MMPLGSGMATRRLLGTRLAHEHSSHRSTITAAVVMGDVGGWPASTSTMRPSSGSAARPITRL
jgi:hypothetical protein